jgi:hypothetical protein
MDEITIRQPQVKFFRGFRCVKTMVGPWGLGPQTLTLSFDVGFLPSYTNRARLGAFDVHCA